jgi:tryptophan 7-halogenase
VRKIAVVGIGSAGILSICNLLPELPSYRIYSINDPSIPSVGIGESTNPFFLESMFKCLRVTSTQVLKSDALDATIKHGTFFKDWADKDFLNPLFGEAPGRIAIHFNTYKIKDYAFSIIRQRYKNQFKEIEGHVSKIENRDNRAIVVVDNEELDFDYVIDCRGFPKGNDDEYVFMKMPANRCLVHNVEGNFTVDDWGYTLHQATQDGWMFGVPLRNRKSYGYLFNDTFTDINTAKKNFSNLIGVEESKLQNIEYKFRSYYTKRILNGRIFKNGNTASFLEPMFASSLFLYNFNINMFLDYIHGSVNDPNRVNYIFYKQLRKVHDLICFFYNGGNKFNTDFWKYAKQYSQANLKISPTISKLDDSFEFMKNTNQRFQLKEMLFSTDTFLLLDKSLGYNKWN